MNGARRNLGCVRLSRYCSEVRALQQRNNRTWPPRAWFSDPSCQPTCPASWISRARARRSDRLLGAARHRCGAPRGGTQFLDRRSLHRSRPGRVLWAVWRAACWAIVS